MALNKQKLEDLLNLIDQIVAAPGNEWFVRRLSEKFGNKEHSSKYKLTAPTQLERIEKYLSIDFETDYAESTIDYSFIKDDIIRNQLIADNREMKRYRLGLRAHTENFDEFCRSSVLQLEMLLNYYYKNKFKKFGAFRYYIEKETSTPSNPVHLEKCKNYGAVALGLKITAFKKEHKDALGYEISNTLFKLKDVRNELSHRGGDKVEITPSNEEYQFLLEKGMPLKNNGDVDFFALILAANKHLKEIFDKEINGRSSYKKYSFAIWYNEKLYDTVEETLTQVAQIIKDTLS